MRETDLLDRRIPIQIGDREFTFRRLTLGAVLEILVRFDMHLRRFAVSGAQDVQELIRGLSPRDTADLFSFMLEPFDPEYLARTLKATPDDPAANDQKRAKLAELMSLAVTFNNLRRIWDSLTFPKAGQTNASPVAERVIVPPLLVAVDAICERYKADPYSVMKWPYEGFLTITEIMEDHARQREVNAMKHILASNGLDPKLADLPGMHYSPVHTDLSKEH